jgi:predicted AlkP superfamily pyrophosphatase or phosphodiesterase
METLKEVDSYIGEIVEQVKASGRPTHVAVVSDHGFLPLSTMLQPNTAFKNEGLLTLNERGIVASWRAYFHASGGSGYVYVKDPADRARVHQILIALKKDPANGIREIWTADDLAKRGAHPDAAFGLDVVDGFYTGPGHDVLVKPSTTKGEHGFGPDRKALQSSFIMTGPNVQRRGNIGVINMTQIAPTLAKILGVSLSPVAAKPLALDGPAETATCP